ncbi:MAG: alkaline phosphatase [Planctomycetaceae bacterium]|nr:alkaline phosphatase [Planctomycetaceae bacterium]
MRPAPVLLASLALVSLTSCNARSDDEVVVKVNPSDRFAVVQAEAIAAGRARAGFWGTDPENYVGWKTHSNRLIPVYTFGTQGGGAGIDIDSYSGVNSPYRSPAALQRIYGFLPEQTVNPDAVWMDQTNVADIQRAAVKAGRKYIFLVVFDGMDWQSTQLASISQLGRVAYTEGRGTGLHFLDYTAAGTTQFGFMVTSPHNEGTEVDVDQQTVKNPGGTLRGGYHAGLGGTAPWATPSDMGYLIAKPAEGNIRHAYTDSSSSASSMTAALKTFNGSINVGPTGELVSTIAHELQEEGWAVGAVSSVPVSHATPAAAYAHNVSRDDYQDLTRDMVGLKSVTHPGHPLPGLDVLIGGGWGVDKEKGPAQGTNFVPGNVYVTQSDIDEISVQNGGRYEVAVRTAGHSGSSLLQQATQRAVAGKHRLFGLFGLAKYNGHLPFATADGTFDPVPGVGKKAEVYTDADRQENPTLSEMTQAAITVLSQNDHGFWLMVESGDVDWANHDDNIDNSAGAVKSGDAAVRVITDWVEQNSNWQESLLIVTADHGHYFNLTHSEELTGVQTAE